MRILLFLLVSVFATATTATAQTSLENARRAQAMLGGETWSQVVRIHNTATSGPYPSRVYALVFEEGGLLWFYTDIEGTQSLSLHYNRLAQEKADLATLLKAIHPGFTRFTVIDSKVPAAWTPTPEPLQNGCFVECVAALRQRVMLGDRVEQPRLLSCYVDTHNGRRGHTVLTYRTQDGFFLLDPTVSWRPRALPEHWADNAQAVATAALAGPRVSEARWVPTDMPQTVLVAHAGADRGELSAEDETPHATQ